MKQLVRITKDLPELKLVGRRLRSAAAGQEIEVESWEASVLERHGFVEPVQKITATELRKQILAEERTSTLEPLPQDFYARVANKVENLQRAGQADRLGELREATSSLVEMRVQKLVHLAASEVGPRDLPPEEQFLLNRFGAALDNWKEWLDHLLRREIKEVGGYEEKFGESVRYAVGDAADIQE